MRRIGVDDGHQIVLVDVADIYYLEADGHDTLIRTHRKRLYRSRERLEDLRRRVSAAGSSFFSPHRSFVVNLDRVRLVRRRAGRGWELRLDPPVNAIIPLARSREKALFDFLAG